MRVLASFAYACATFALLSFLSPSVISNAMSVAGSASQSPLSADDAIVGFCGGRLVWNSASEIQFNPYNGSYIEVATRKVALPTQPCVVTDSLLDLDGTRKVATPAADTLHYAYVSVYGELALSTHAPIFRPASLTQYLSDIDQGPLWRFVGWVRTGAGPSFEDSPSRRCVVNWYNRRPLPLFVCPNYADNNATTTYDVTSANWATLDATSKLITIAGARLGLVDVELVFSASLVGAGGGQLSVHAQQPGLLPQSDRRNAVLIANGALRSASCRLVAEFEDEAVVEITPEFISAALTTVIADNARNGAVADPPMTYLVGWVDG